MTLVFPLVYQICAVGLLPGTGKACGIPNRILPLLLPLQAMLTIECLHRRQVPARADAMAHSAAQMASRAEGSGGDPTPMSSTRSPRHNRRRHHGKRPGRALTADRRHPLSPLEE